MNIIYYNKAILEFKKIVFLFKARINGSVIDKKIFIIF